MATLSGDAIREEVGDRPGCESPGCSGVLVEDKSVTPLTEGDLGVKSAVPAKAMKCSKCGTKRRVITG